MLIVLEGLDGAGKSTQVELVRRMFAQEGVESHFLHFPRFDAPVYGELIARFLRGEFGGVGQVDPYLVALLFAGDRIDRATAQPLPGGQGTGAEAQQFEQLPPVKRESCVRRRVHVVFPQKSG